MEPQPPRIATLVLVDGGGTVLGMLRPFEAATPWWNDLAPVVQAVRARDGVRVTILRLLDAERPCAHGGAVTYLAQIDDDAPIAALQPWPGTLTEHPLRLPYACVGGPHADVAWARGVIEAKGGTLTGEPQQIRSWNLSSLWQLPTSLGTTWLKAVPPFFAHEGKVLAALHDAPVPRLLGHDGARMLLAHIDGDDLYHASAADCLPMIDLLAALQRTWLGRTDELLALGLPDWRGPAITRSLGTLLARRGSELDAADRVLLGDFIGALPARFAAIAACGIADGLVHGDFHPGNLRGRAGDPGSLHLLDWGDCGVGHPLLDQPAFLDRMPADGVAAARRHWAAAWQRDVPGADAERAAQLLAPVAAARQALIYQSFLDGIEDSEQPYHRADVGDWLRRCAGLLRAEGSGTAAG